MTKELKKELRKIIIASVIFLVVFLSDKTLNLINRAEETVPKGIAYLFGEKYGFIFAFILYFSIYIYVGKNVIIDCVKNLFHGRILDENFLMTLATFGAFGLGIFNAVSGLSIEGFDEGTAVMLLYQIGEWFQSYATLNSRKSISELMDIRPEFATVIREGKIFTVRPEEVKVGEKIVVKAGEKIPLDGVISAGESSLDAKALTGETAYLTVKVGDSVASGCINLTAPIYIEVKNEYQSSTVAKILELIEKASDKKSKAENFITEFSKYYTPIVVISAIVLALVPSLIIGNVNGFIYRALSFLVVSCPCALVISVPLSFFAGIGKASKNGILIKGANCMEKMAKTNVFVFDKTGTLTKGEFGIYEISPKEKKEEVLRLASICEELSIHPVAKCILNCYGKETEKGYSITDLAGKGVIAKKGKEEILCGNEKLMQEKGIKIDVKNSVGTVIYVAKNGIFVGSIELKDRLKKEAKEVITSLNESGARTVMLTGDVKKVAENIKALTGISEIKAKLLPQGKVEEVEKLKGESKKNVLCFIGDGINDAPVLMRSDVGVSMGRLGSEVAIEASDIVLMKDDLRGIIKAKEISEKTMKVVRENVCFAIGIKLAILILSAFGLSNMWFAVFGDVGVTILAILNAMRISIKGKNER